MSVAVGQPPSPCRADSSVAAEDLCARSGSRSEAALAVAPGEQGPGFTEPLVGHCAERALRDPAGHREGTEAGGRQGQLVVHDAVWVTGIDNTDPANPMVVLNDSGHPDGTRRR